MKRRDYINNLAYYLCSRCPCPQVCWCSCCASSLLSARISTLGTTQVRGHQHLHHGPSLYCSLISYILSSGDEHTYEGSLDNVHAVAPPRPGEFRLLNQIYLFIYLLNLSSLFIYLGHFLTQTCISRLIMTLWHSELAKLSYGSPNYFMSFKKSSISYPYVTIHLLF